MTNPGPVALITGASSGIGQAISDLLVTNGYTVYGTSRAPFATASGPVPLIPLDVRLDSSVEACVKAVLARSRTIDILINNAGVALLGAAEEMTLADAVDQFETNFFGVVRMIKAVAPIMRSARAGRIINIGSLAGLVALPFAALYSASKAALGAYSDALRHELRPFRVLVSLIEPEFVKTRLAASGRSGNNPISAYDAARTRALRAFQQSVTQGIASTDVARCVWQVIRARDPRPSYRVGAAAVWLPRLKAAVPWWAFEAGMRRKF